MAEYGVIVEKNMRSKGIGKQLLNFVLNGEESINEQNPGQLVFMNIWELKHIKGQTLMKKEIFIHYCI